MDRQVDRWDGAEVTSLSVYVFQAVAVKGKVKQVLISSRLLVSVSQSITDHQTCVTPYSTRIRLVVTTITKVKYVIAGLKETEDNK